MTKLAYKVENILRSVEEMGFVCKINNDISLAAYPWSKRTEYVYFSNFFERDYIKIHTDDNIIKGIYYILNSQDIRGELKIVTDLSLFEKLAELRYSPAVSYMRNYYIDLVLEDNF